uniref:Uncharacterized protein n=1 Tax=Lepeophtheirus salmonis TaxID=72036 RepID=A0A0K2SZS2_LEPSM
MSLQKNKQLAVSNKLDNQHAYKPSPRLISLPRTPNHIVRRNQQIQNHGQNSCHTLQLLLNVSLQ